MLTFSRNSTVGDVARKVMGDVPIAYVEGAGGTRVSEDDIVSVGKHDVCADDLLILSSNRCVLLTLLALQILSFKAGR